MTQFCLVAIVILSITAMSVSSATVYDGLRISDETTVDCSPPVTQCRDNTSHLPLPLPHKNTYQCYKTCTNGSDCEANAISLPQPTVILSGPHNLQHYSIHYITSPRSSNNSILYPNNHLCKYNIGCEEDDSYMSVSISNLQLEPESVQCRDPTICRDHLKLYYPTGTECKMCGSETKCYESGGEVDPLQVFDGKQGLKVSFQSNRRGSGCGFHLLATCAKRRLFESPNCTIPTPPPPPTSSTPFPLDFSKRDVPDNSSTETSRPRRFFHTSGILVSGSESVLYDDNLVLVKIGNTIIHSFPGIQVLQVYNDIEGSMTFYGTANDRAFPGYGVLNVGLGIIQYTQESVPSQFKPNGHEQSLILLLHRAIQSLQDSGDSGEGCAVTLTDEERERVDEIALENGRACNGFLRAAACGYQQLTMSSITSDCVAYITASQTHPEDYGSGLFD